MVVADFLESYRGERVKVTLSKKNIAELLNNKMLHGFKVDIEVEEWISCVLIAEVDMIRKVNADIVMMLN